MSKRPREESNAELDSETAPSKKSRNNDLSSKQTRKLKKAERKARRAAKKDKKAQTEALRNKQLDIENKASETDSSNPVGSLHSSGAPSQGPSSATSPEPGDPAVHQKTSPSNSLQSYQNDVTDVASQAEIDAFLVSNQITVSDPSHPLKKLQPIRAFSKLPISDNGVKATLSAFVDPTPIQAAAWPFLFNGRDVIGVAETGSGKTLAFGLPCVRHFASMRERGDKAKGPGAVIVSPTRELALQIQEQLFKVAKPAGLKVSCIYGGVPKDEQRVALKKSEIIVATPGRLNDLLSEDGTRGLKQVKFLVLDEADRMLDKGFEEDIRKIVSATAPPEQRQTLMFTATWPPSIRELAETFMRSPVMITIGDNPSGELRANARITQTVEVIEPRNKEFRLLQLLREHQSGKQKDDRILIFCLYKKEATRVENFIHSKGFRVAGIHGDLSQAQREKSLDAFKQGKVPLLVATDVAARGLDIPAVKLVINVTFPLTAEDYVHRIGRTGRAGNTGQAITLFTENDKALSGALINVLKAANQPVPEELLKFGTTVKKKTHDAYGAFYKDTTDVKKATKITFDD